MKMETKDKTQMYILNIGRQRVFVPALENSWKGWQIAHISSTGQKNPSKDLIEEGERVVVQYEGVTLEGFVVLSERMDDSRVEKVMQGAPTLYDLIKAHDDREETECAHAGMPKEYPFGESC